MPQQLSSLVQNTLAVDVTNITGTIPVAKGGTGATTAATALTNLGAYAATNPSGYTTNTGTVTAVAALTLGTTGTDVTSTVATGTTTPVITLNLPTASASNRGALSAADWTTFNSKLGSYTETDTLATVTARGATTTVVPTFSNGATINGNTVIAVTDNTNAALRITQLGTGNALLVEDSTNPDASPFVISAGGQVVMGYTAQLSGAQYNPTFEIFGADSSESGIGQFQYGANGSAARYQFNKTRGATANVQTVVASGDELGTIQFAGSDGTGYIRGATIVAAVDGTPGTNDMPGRLVFSTTADGASSPTERMRINSSGNVNINKSLALTAGSITLAEAWQLQWGNGSTYINGTNNVIYSNAGNANVFTGTATAFTVMPSTTSSSTTSGALVVNGGAGIAGNVFAGSLTTAGVISGKISASVYQDKVTAVAASTATTVIDLSLSNSFVITISASTTISFTNPPAGTDITSFTLITVNNATAGYAISWPASVTWAGGVTPARTTAANKSDVYTFFTRDAGAQFVGSLAVLNY